MNSTPAPAAAGAAQPQVFNLRDRITVLTPCYDFSLSEYYHSSLAACLEAKARFRMPDGSVQILPIIAGRISLPNDSHVDRARNVIANLWVDADETDLALWWDADIEKRPEHIMRLWVHAMHGTRFVCGHYAMKTLTPTFVANVRAGARPDPSTGLIELLHGGTGSMLWHRSVPLRLREHPAVKPYKCAPNTPFAGKKFWAYFSSGVWAPKAAADASANALPDWESEDWMVCKLWQDLGEKVYGDTEVKLRHLGRMLYPPTVGELEDAICALLNQRHPALDIARLRQALDRHAQPAAA